MDIGVLLPTGKAQWGAEGDPRELVAFAVRAEQLGFSSLFVNDSLISPRIEALTMLAALAPVTERVTLGTGALLPFLRRPIQAAQSLASVDLLSGGRLAVAVGASFPGRFGQPFYTLSEVPWERRFSRLDETVKLWRELWSGANSFHGDILKIRQHPARDPAFPRRRPADLARRCNPSSARPYRTALRRLASLSARPRRLPVRSAGRPEGSGPSRTVT
jgi:alkanesulfonate monooxygenase SsuD/methylene tetrahydromethanopterin reductase-like flavin-dependent oxidoreductase (luciferase family)